MYVCKECNTEIRHRNNVSRQKFQIKLQSPIITLHYTTWNCSRNYSNSKGSKKTMKYQKSKSLVTIIVSTVAIINFKTWFSQNYMLDFLDKMQHNFHMHFFSRKWYFQIYWKHLSNSVYYHKFYRLIYYQINSLIS